MTAKHAARMIRDGDDGPILKTVCIVVFGSAKAGGGEPLAKSDGFHTGNGENRFGDLAVERVKKRLAKTSG